MEGTKNMKRLLALLFAMAMIAAACGNDTDIGAADDAEAGAEVEEEFEEAMEDDESDEAMEDDEEAMEDDESDEAVEDDEEVELVQGDSVLDRIAETGVVRVGVRNDNPPVSFIDENGDWVGFDLDLAQALADELGAELELVPVDGTTRISFLESCLLYTSPSPRDS